MKTIHLEDIAGPVTGIEIVEIQPITQRVAAALRADWGPSLRSAATTLAAVCVAVYAAGIMTGEFVHSVNAKLSSFISSRVATVAPAAPAPIVEPIPQMVIQRQALQPIATIAAPDLSTLTVVQLRQMARAAGHKGLARSGRRADLLQALA
jgi:hypothetical protein